METIFIISICTIIFIYAGYGLFIWVLNRINPNSAFKNYDVNYELPEVAIVVAAYNEEDIIEEKIINTLNLDYPNGKLKMYIISDGSIDKTNEIVSKYPQVTLYHQPERKGKSEAINRIMPLIKEPITIFTDANVKINSVGVSLICGEYVDSAVGGVSGEKIVLCDERAASASTEGSYWKYESFLKKEDARLSSLIGAAGELFSIRTALFESIPEDTLLDDFTISLNVMRKGYKIAYAPGAFAMEKPSFNINEEYKRKVRISAGGIQSVIRNSDLLNISHYGIIALQFLIHRVSRWTIAPLALIAAFISSFYVWQNSQLLMALFSAQILFYFSGLIGLLNKDKNIKSRLITIPFYFLFMHYCVIAGWFRYFSGNQKAAWQKATRLKFN